MELVSQRTNDMQKMFHRDEKLPGIKLKTFNKEDCIQKVFFTIYFGIESLKLKGGF